MGLYGPVTDPGFLEKGVLMYKGVGFVLLNLSIFS